jgi:CelD/BcsL family acetyltransferase involved in cellulose biosynthesis
MTLIVERMAGPESLDALSIEWEELHSRTTPRTPFTSPLWNRLWWQHFSEHRLLVRDEFFVHIVRDEHGSLVAVAPLMLTHRPSMGPLHLRQLHFFGADSNVTELRGVICAPEDHDDVLVALRSHLLTQSSEWDSLQWSGVRDDSRVRDVADGHGPAVEWRRSTADYYLALPARWEDMRSGMSRNLKEALRKCYNSLRREKKDFVFRAVRSPQEIAAALATLFDLHSARARAIGLAPHPDAFVSATVRDFFADYARRMAERDQLRIFQLEIEGEIVATRAAIVFGDDLYLMYSGYRPEWGKKSIMTTLIAETFKWAIANQIRGVNLSTGKDLSKTRWKPTELLFWDGMQRSSSYKGRMVSLAYDGIVSTTPRASSLVWLLSLIRRHR